MDIFQKWYFCKSESVQVRRVWKLRVSNFGRFECSGCLRFCKLSKFLNSKIGNLEMEKHEHWKFEIGKLENENGDLQKWQLEFQDSKMLKLSLIAT